MFYSILNICPKNSFHAYTVPNSVPAVSLMEIVKWHFSPESIDLNCTRKRKKFRIALGPKTESSRTKLESNHSKKKIQYFNDIINRVF